MSMHLLNQTRDSLLKSLHLQRPTGPANCWKSLQTQDARGIRKKENRKRKGKVEGEIIVKNLI